MSRYLRCVKCGSEEIRTTYHGKGCERPGCTICSKCSSQSHNKRHNEHLHRVCQGCFYDWTDDVDAEWKPAPCTCGAAAIGYTCKPDCERVKKALAGDAE